jgi:hypothetical protein
MSYSEEQTRAYESMMYDFGHFNTMKKTLSKIKCPVHNKQLKMEANWENDYDIDIEISKYCCIDFAKQIEKEFIDADRFKSITIAKQ